MRVFGRMILVFTVLFILTGNVFSAPFVAQTDKLKVRIDVIAEGLRHPWSLAFLPNGDMLVTERPGRLRIVRNGRLDPQPIEGGPRIVAQGQGGLMDVVLHPNFDKNRTLYIAYVSDGPGGLGTEVVKAIFNGHQLRNTRIIYRAKPESRGSRHFGGRLAFDRRGYLYLTLGDRGDRDRAQQPDDPVGSVIRLTDDGRVPADNPFVDSWQGAIEVFSFGHRNPQGLTLNPRTGDLWLVEHGPKGGDELNILRPAANYGWPVITYGREYTGGKIGEGTHKAGMEQPLHYWVPSISPSGMSFYTGNLIQPWKGDLLVGALSGEALVRLEIRDNQIVAEERMFVETIGRVRDVRIGPDEAIYLLTDHRNGRLLRIAPFTN